MAITEPVDVLGGGVSLSFVESESLLSEGTYFKSGVQSSDEAIYLRVECRYGLFLAGGTGEVVTYIKADLLDRFMDDSLVCRKHLEAVEFEQAECILCMDGEIDFWYTHPRSREGYGMMHLQCYLDLCDAIERYVDSHMDSLVAYSI